MIWRIIDHSLITGQYQPSEAPETPKTAPIKVAAFDLDDTLIVANSGSKWARSATSWKWWDGSIPTRLKALHKEGYIIVVISNQGNVSLKVDPKSLQKDSKSLTNLKAQITSIFQQLDFSIHFYAATTQDRYRKPRTGMWDRLLDDLHVHGVVDMPKSFYVGDAAGREKADKRAKDHANSDR